MSEVKSKATQVVQLIVVDPDQLIDMGHRLKQTAMDTCYPGDTVILQFTDKIIFSYTPEREYLKPVITVGHQTAVGTAMGTLPS